MFCLKKTIPYHNSVLSTILSHKKRKLKPKRLFSRYFLLILIFVRKFMPVFTPYWWISYHQCERSHMEEHTPSKFIEEQSDMMMRLGGHNTRHMKAFTWRSVWDSSKFSQNFQSCLELSNGRCPWVWLYHSCFQQWEDCIYANRCNLSVLVIGISIFSYRRGLWRCLFNKIRQCEKPRWVGQATRKFPRFFMP